MRLARFIVLSLLGLLPGEVSPNEIGWLLSPRLHLPLLKQRRALMISNRVRLFAALFALLTPLWIVVDVATLPSRLWVELAMLRLTTSAAFFWLVWQQPRVGRLTMAYRGMGVLFMLPSLFYLLSNQLLASHHLFGLAAAIGTGYAFLPFVLLAGLAIFPLTLLENLAFAFPILCVYALSFAFNWATVSAPAFGGQFWLLLLLTGVASLASMSQLAFIIALVNQAIHDPLTGCFSRRSGEELLNLQMISARRSQTALTVAFLDIDQFKSINDQFGHEAGDRVLRQIQPRIAACLRRGDTLVRWGGEEFLLLMPHVDMDQALLALERLRQFGLGARPDGSPLTISVGLAERIRDDVRDWKALVDIADSRMYRAKRSGRDRIVCHD
ncbi:GGDEF domain-containing protein [Paludibacterium yongneupense]|uniref:GGDEF domain-containing protein n=1 Tax=Paludibacterium yongneupense TaxID=400061 RepID=UPI000428B079|nr:sensor domain-containing diguanylate cyclase [Paludibacterium yongneupense]